MKRKIYNPYNFKIVHRLANGTQVNEQEIKEIMSKLPEVQVTVTAKEVTKCINI